MFFPRWPRLFVVTCHVECDTFFPCFPSTRRGRAVGDVGQPAADFKVPDSAQRALDTPPGLAGRQAFGRPAAAGLRAGFPSRHLFTGHARPSSALFSYLRVS